MDKIELVANFFQAIEKRDWYKLFQLLDEDYQYLGPLPDPVGKETWIEFEKAVQNAFPDWSYNISKIELIGEDVEVTVNIEATHTQPLQLPWVHMKPIPASGTKISLPQEKATLKFRGDKIKELRVHQVFEGGLPGLLEKLGLE